LLATPDRLAQKLCSPLGRFLFLYAAMYAAFGIASPLWPRFFEARALSHEEIGTLLAAGMLGRLISGPIVGRLADFFGALRATLGICAALAAGFALTLLTAETFWPLLVAHLAHAAALAPVTATADALAVNAAWGSTLRRGFEYGWVRGAASLAFVVGALMMGQLLGHTDISAIAWMQASLLLAAIGAVALVPRLEDRASEQSNPIIFRSGGMRELLQIPVFRRLLVIVALVYGSHAVHDAFAVIRWSHAGIGPGTTSVLLSEAVAAEVIVFFLVGPFLLNRFGPHGAAVLAAMAGVVRWLVASQTTSIVALGIIQPLHGFSFALLHLACMRLIGMSVPVRLAATAQALYALSAGVATMGLTLMSGGLYAAYGGNAFLPMALLCAIAVPLAWIGLRAPVAR
jgi:MFS transporter, PPP family, 3-phenylpropionic acid transporter